jgi:hypothetical protein
MPATRPPIVSIALGAVALFLVSSPARAALIAYDGFDYTAGAALSGQNGGSGFSGAWVPGGFNASISSNYTIEAGSQSFGNLATSGNSVVTGSTTAIAGLTRNLSSTIGAAGTTVYLSFVVEPRGTLNGGVFNGFFGLLFEQAGEPEIFMGKPGGGDLGDYVIEDRGGGAQFSSQVPLQIDQSALLVVKAEFGAGSDTFSFYLNPVPGSPAPVPHVVKTGSDNGTITGLTIYSSGAFALDEVRMGTTFEDVTPAAQSVPETGPGMPATCIAFASFICLHSMHRRRQLRR